MNSRDWVGVLAMVCFYTDCLGYRHMSLKDDLGRVYINSKLLVNIKLCKK